MIKNYKIITLCGKTKLFLRSAERAWNKDWKIFREGNKRAGYSMIYEQVHKFLKVKQREMAQNRHLYNATAIAINDKAIEAVEKQIPKKPVPSVLYNAKFWCVCGFGIKQQYEDTMFKIQYCPWCGQALDWSEKNEEN